MQFDYELVGKIGSMALIRRAENDIDYNIFSRLGKQLKPGMIWVTSGATEIGRLDYIRRAGKPLELQDEISKTDYSAQGQPILMELYRQFVKPEYSIRQVLVEHQHFNDEHKREYIRQLLLRASQQNAIPIVNYNDAVSEEENRRWELSSLRDQGAAPVECVDNDETAAVIAKLVRARYLVILTSVEGIYRDPNDAGTLVHEITGADAGELEHNIRAMQRFCVGASRPGAGGAHAKLEYVRGAALQGTTVIIGHGRHGIEDLVQGRVACTRIGIR